MTELTVPTLNSNDTDARLQAWLKATGESVSTGDVVAVLETTKASYDLTAECDGILQQRASEGELCPFGSTVGAIFSNAAELDANRTAEPYPQSRNDGEPDSPGSVPPGKKLTITRAAREIIEKNRISKQALAGLGRTVIRASDLESIASDIAPKAEAAEEIDPSRQEEQTTREAPLSRRQEGVARLVARSHREIPAALHVKKILVDDALDELSATGKQCRTMLGLPELLIWIAGRLLGEHGRCFGTVTTSGEDIDYRPATEANIGVTIDLGHGLFIPVIRNAAELDLPEIAAAMMAYRAKAMRDNFDADDLAHGSISISLNMAPDTLLVWPLIQSPQVCMLSVSAVLPTVEFDADEQARPAKMIQLALAYDHRIVNGYMADAFLSALKEQVESPDRSSWTANNETSPPS